MAILSLLGNDVHVDLRPAQPRADPIYLGLASLAVESHECHWKKRPKQFE
jgi:hypothetical protein